MSRFIDDFFMTTNQTMNEINVQLGYAQKKDINIEIETTIGTSINYLDVTIINENGKLRTKIFHKPTAQPYYLPYTSDHPHRYRHNIPYTALLRAARLCSNVNDFNQERLRIDVTLLLSEYPPNVISNQFLRFFQVNQAESVFKQLDEQAYQRLHQKVLHQPRKNSNKISNSIKDLVENPPVLQTKPWDNNIMCPRHKFERGPRVQFATQFFAWWQKYYQYPGSAVNNVNIRLIPETNRTLEKFLLHKKPPTEMLTRMEPTTS